MKITLVEASAKGTRPRVKGVEARHYEAVARDLPAKRVKGAKAPEG